MAASFQFSLVFGLQAIHIMQTQHGQLCHCKVDSTSSRHSRDIPLSTWQTSVGCQDRKLRIDSQSTTERLTIPYRKKTMSLCISCLQWWVLLKEWWEDLDLSHDFDGHILSPDQLWDRLCPQLHCYWLPLFGCCTFWYNLGRPVRLALHLLPTLPLWNSKHPLSTSLTAPLLKLNPYQVE